MSDCPEPVRQVVLHNGVAQTLRHILAHVTSNKKRAQAACCSYEADERDHYELTQALRQEEVLTRACEDLTK